MKKPKKFLSQLELMRSIRKPALPANRTHSTKTTYSRRDKSWKNES